MISVIDYGVGNVSAFVNVFKRLNISVNVARSVSDLAHSKKLILPGVGSFDRAMIQLNKSGMRDELDRLVLHEKLPVLGICVGMQMMGKKSEEGIERGLEWIDAEILKFDASLIRHRTKIPHMGWNSVDYSMNNLLFSGLDEQALFYFLHSYYFHCHDENLTIARTFYGSHFSSGIQSNNIYGIQFHPEKSHRNGEILLDNFAKI